MNLDNLKPAWRQFRLNNAMRPMGGQDLLLILERAEDPAISKSGRVIMHAIVVIVIAFCCTGG